MCGLVIKLHKITFSLFRISHRLVHDSMMIGVIGSSKLIGVCCICCNGSGTHAKVILYLFSTVLGKVLLHGNTIFANGFVCC